MVVIQLESLRTLSSGRIGIIIIITYALLGGVADCGDRLDRFRQVVKHNIVFIIIIVLQSKHKKLILHKLLYRDFTKHLFQHIK